MEFFFGCIIFGFIAVYIIYFIVIAAIEQIGKSNAALQITITPDEEKDRDERIENIEKDIQNKIAHLDNEIRKEIFKKTDEKIDEIFGNMEWIDW